jgi:hypothetical protein
VRWLGIFPSKTEYKNWIFYATFLTYQNSFVYLKGIYLHVISFEGYSVTATMFMQKSHLKIKGKRHGRSLCLLLDLFNFFSLSQILFQSLPTTWAAIIPRRKFGYYLGYYLGACISKSSWSEIGIVYFEDRGSMQIRMVQISVALKSLKQLGLWLYRKVLVFSYHFYAQMLKFI